jgi:quercetin dioxygenase-like cupin family protein
MSAEGDLLEDPDANPIGTELVYEDDAVKIWRIAPEPGQDAPWHTHVLDYTTVVVDGGVVERPNDDGTVDRFELEPGDFMRGRQGTIRHMVRNVGDTAFSNVIIELKGTRLEIGE